jgi:Family of unknown function (DUF6152)
MKVKVFALAGMGLMLAGSAAFAHHSFAMFDGEKMSVQEGTVKELEWTNPHVWLHIVAPDETGRPRDWGFEMQSVAQASSGGWRANTLKPGDKVTIEFHPLKDGSRGGELVAATLPDGRRLGSSATRPPPAKSGAR